MRRPQQRALRLDAVRIGLDTGSASTRLRTELNRVRPPPSVASMQVGCRVLTRGLFSQADGKGAQPSQGKGRAQIVVELKRDLLFEIVWGSQGGAAECCGDPK